MAEIHHRIGIASPAADVYRALTTNEGLAGWWTGDTRGAGPVGAVIELRFNGGGPDFEVTELQPDKLVAWRHTGNIPEEWMGTEVTFQLEQGSEQTIVKFCHSDWHEASDFMGHCSTKWAVFLLSLKQLLETGAGKPFPDDIQIDHS
jgi:uncharacterized protein YndB with AHSA1/START domain